ncbi:MAG: flagellar filament capping protein FliD [Oscillospiraceae bacterium]|jgi:flagellar capping protein FliD|nr:flagellar filament capping protein FliD [Oscillospiraceae bacterium]
MSSTSSVSSSANLQTSSVYRLTGSNLYSGLDTDSIVKSLVSHTQSRIDKQEQLEQTAEWRRDLFRDVTSDLQDFKDTYFSYASESNLLSPKFFESSNVDSSSGVVTATGNVDNAQNLVINSISQLASTASYNSAQQVSNKTITSGTIQNTWQQSDVGGKSLVVTYNDTDYTLTLGSSVTLDPDNINSDPQTELQKIVDGLNSQISQNSSLNSKVKFELNADNSIALSSTDGTDTVGIKAYKASDDDTSGVDFLNAIGLQEESGTGSVAGTAITDTSALFKNATLGDTLSGSTVTFTLDGISKEISFDAGADASYDTSAELASYLQGKLNSAFGTDKVNVTDNSGNLQFTTIDSTSVLSIDSSSNSNVLGQDGALRIATGTANRINTGKTLAELADKFSRALQDDGDGNYKMNINGTELSFTGDTTLSDVISQINNNEDIGVTVAYSQTTDSFRITADDSGSQGKIEFSDVSGKLAATLFGTYDSTKLTAGQDLKMNVTINGTKMDIVRSSNTTTLDGVTLDVTGETTEPVSFSTPSNVDDLSDKIVDFVNAYNKIIDKVNTLNSESQERDSDHQVKYEPLTDAQKEEMTDDEIEKWEEKAKKGLLQNDSALSGVLNDLREAMTTKVESAGLSLSQLGISTKAYDYKSGGQLVVDTDKLKQKLQSDPDAVTELFTAEDGVSSRVQKALDKYVGTFGGDGILLLRAGKESSANDTSQLTLQIKQYQDTVSNLKEQLETEETRYWKKFTAMEQALSTLTAQSDYLASMMSGSSNY